MSDVKLCNDFRIVEAGDLVYSLLHGWGRVVHNRARCTTYKVSVYFPGLDIVESFTHDGYFETDNVNPVLFWGKPVIHSKASAPAHFFNLNGCAVFESPIKAPEDIEVGMFVATSSQECGYMVLAEGHDIEGLSEYWLKHGMVYPASERGRLWASMHGKAFVGEGTPYEA